MYAGKLVFSKVMDHLPFKKASGATAETAYVKSFKYRDAATGKTFRFLTNNFATPTGTVADLYRCRRQVKLFFK